MSHGKHSMANRITTAGLFTKYCELGWDGSGFDAKAEAIGMGAEQHGIADVYTSSNLDGPGTAFAFGDGSMVLIRTDGYAVTELVPDSLSEA